MLASLSRANRRAGLDVQTRIAEVSQAASTRDSRPLLLLKDPTAADDSCAADAHRPAVDDVFGQACCHDVFGEACRRLLQLMLVSQQHQV